MEIVERVYGDVVAKTYKCLVEVEKHVKWGAPYFESIR
jgi:hypothetical protein